jgi:hypothetical protein
MVQALATKGLEVKDLIVLSGTRTLGKVRCSSYADCLYVQHPGPLRVALPPRSHGSPMPKVEEGKGPICEKKESLGGYE